MADPGTGDREEKYQGRDGVRTGALKDCKHPNQKGREEMFRNGLTVVIIRDHSPMELKFTKEPFS